MSYVGNKGPADDIGEEGFTSRIRGVSGKELGRLVNRARCFNTISMKSSSKPSKLGQGMKSVTERIVSKIRPRRMVESEAGLARART